MKSLIYLCLSLQILTSPARAQPKIPYPSWVSIGNAPLVNQPAISALTWKKLYCQGEMNESCFNHLAFSIAANQKSLSSPNLGLKAALASTNEILRKYYAVGRRELSIGEVDQLQRYISHITTKHDQLRAAALSQGGKWDDDESVKVILDISKSLAGPALGGSIAINEAIIGQLDKFLQPYRKFRSEGNYYAAQLEVHNLGDVYGDLYLMSKIMKGVDEAVDPGLARHLGIMTKMTGKEIVENDALIKTLFLSENNALLLKAILDQVKNGDQLNIKKLEEIRQELLKQHLAVREAGKKITEEDPAIILAKIADYDASLRIFNSLAAFVEDPKLKKTIYDTSVVGKAALTVYRCALNSENLVGLF